MGSLKVLRTKMVTEINPSVTVFNLMATTSSRRHQYEMMWIEVVENKESLLK